MVTHPTGRFPPASISLARDHNMLRSTALRADLPAVSRHAGVRPWVVNMVHVAEWAMPLAFGAEHLLAHIVLVHRSSLLIIARVI